MKRIIVIGCPGSGKSTFSKQLHQLTGLPLFHLDMLNWNADRTVVEKHIFRKKLEETICQDSWIIDGNYGSTIELRLRACDTVFFLDYPLEVCLDGIITRRGKPRTDMPWVESEDEIDEEFLEFIREYNFVSRPKIMDLLNKYADKRIVIFKSRMDADRYLENL